MLDNCHSWAFGTVGDTIQYEMSRLDSADNGAIDMIMSTSTPSKMWSRHPRARAGLKSLNQDSEK